MTDYLDSVDERYRRAAVALQELLEVDGQYARRSLDYRESPLQGGNVDSDRFWAVMSAELYGRIAALVELDFAPDEGAWSTIVAYAVGQDYMERLRSNRIPGVDVEGPTISTPMPQRRSVTRYPDGGVEVTYDDGSSEHLAGPFTLSAGDTISFAPGSIKVTGI